MKQLLIFVFFSISLFAHDLHHKVLNQEAVVVAFSFGGDSDFSYQAYEVYAPKSDLPFCVGRTDKLSRVLFIPNCKGEWTVKVLSEDGHGAEVKVTIDKDFGIKDYSQSFFEKFQKAFVGIALIFGVFLLLNLIKKGRK
jgi:nickel transport protein